jgi:hypothetical protein
MNKKRILKSILINTITLGALALLYFECRAYGIVYLIEAYLILKVLSLFLGIYYCVKVKHKPLTVTFVALLIASGGIHLTWIFALAIIYNQYRKRLEPAPVLARFDKKVEDYLIN